MKIVNICVTDVWHTPLSYMFSNAVINEWEFKDSILRRWVIFFSCFNKFGDKSRNSIALFLKMVNEVIHFNKLDPANIKLLNSFKNLTQSYPKTWKRLYTNILLLEFATFDRRYLNLVSFLPSSVNCPFSNWTRNKGWN